MAEHVYLDGKSCNCKKEGNCMICDGGLAICKICGLYEGSLTTECPSYDCYKDKSDDVYAGKIDFRDGKWVKGYTKHMAHIYGNGAK